MALPIVPHTSLWKFFLLSDHLGRDNRCTFWFLPGDRSVQVKLRRHPLPRQVSADPKSLPKGTWGSLQGEVLSSTPETTPSPITPGPAQPAQVIPSPCLRVEPLPNPAHDARRGSWKGGRDGWWLCRDKQPPLAPACEGAEMISVLGSVVRRGQAATPSAPDPPPYHVPGSASGDIVTATAVINIC